MDREPWDTSASERGYASWCYGEPSDASDDEASCGSPASGDGAAPVRAVVLPPALVAVASCSTRADLRREIAALRPSEVNASDRDGRTALVEACSSGNHEFAREVIEAGGNVNQAGLGGWTPLMEAAYGGHAACIDLLIAHHADVEYRSPSGVNALAAAVGGRGRGRASAVDALLRHGAAAGAARALNGRSLERVMQEEAADSAGVRRDSRPYLGLFPDWALPSSERHMAAATQLLLDYAAHTGDGAAAKATRRFEDGLAGIANAPLRLHDGRPTPRAMRAFSRLACARVSDSEVPVANIIAATARLAEVSERTLMTARMAAQKARRRTLGSLLRKKQSLHTLPTRHASLEACASFGDE